jgi:Uma2 family endonuclease
MAAYDLERIGRFMALETLSGLDLTVRKAFPGLHRFSVASYHEMIRHGVLGPDDKVELIHGVVVDKMPQNPIHAGTVGVLKREIEAVLPKSWIVRIQAPISLSDSEPEPDLVIARGPEERYLGEHPGPADIAFLVEVSDSSLTNDQVEKLVVYAEARIPEYWIVNLIEMQVEVYTQPKGGKTPGYKSSRAYGLQFGVPIHLAGKKVGGVSCRKLFDTSSYFPQ